MPHTISDLISSRNLCEADVKATLEAAGLPTDSETYSDEDIHNKFDLIRAFFDKGEVSSYEKAKELFENQTLTESLKIHTTKTKEAGKERRSRKGATVIPINSIGASEAQINPAGEPIEVTAQQKDDSTNLNNQDNLTKAAEPQNNQANPTEENLSISDLIKRVNEQLSLTLTLKQVFTVFEASGLPDKEHYSSSEARRFVLACKVLLQNSPSSQDVGSMIQETATSLEKGMVEVLDQVTNIKAEQVPALMKQLYIKNVVLALAENHEIESFFTQLKSSIIAGIEGKSPLTSIMQVDWMLEPSPESPPSLNQSLAPLEDITTIDTSSESTPNS